MIPIVVDTNILVSGLIVPLGNESFILSGITSSLFTPCYSEEILVEYRDVLNRPKFGFEPDAVSNLFLSLEARGRLINPPATDISLPDPSDLKFIDCAMTAEADYLVTGNRKHFPPGQYGKTTVLNARELIELIALGRPH